MCVCRYAMYVCMYVYRFAMYVCMYIYIYIYVYKGKFLSSTVSSL